MLSIFGKREDRSGRDVAAPPDCNSFHLPAVPVPLSWVGDHSEFDRNFLRLLLSLWISWARGARVWAGGGQRGSVVHGLSTRPEGARAGP